MHASPSPESRLRPHACPACRRRFVVIAGRATSPPRCVCGIELVARGLPGGVYEIRASRRPTRRRARSPIAPPLVPQEPDLGYGESHGYGPAHGGPTGPGDAPADEEPDEAGAAAKAGTKEITKGGEGPA